MFTAALFTIAKLCNQHWYMYTMEYYLAIRNNKIMPFAERMELEIHMLSEISHS
jgi:hypothetical protein